MAWGLSGGAEVVCSPPPQKEGSVTYPTSIRNIAAHSPLGFPRTVQGLGVCILPIKKTPNVPRSALAGGAWTSATLLPPENRTGPPTHPCKGGLLPSRGNGSFHQSLWLVYWRG